MYKPWLFVTCPDLTPPKISPASQQTPPRSLALAPVGWNLTICFSIKSARKGSKCIETDQYQSRQPGDTSRFYLKKMEPLNCGILQIKTPLGGSPREHWPRSSNWHRCGFPSGRSPPTPAVQAYRRRRQKQNGSGDLKGSQNNLELLFTTENCNQAMMYVRKMCVRACVRACVGGCGCGCVCVCVYYVYAFFLPKPPAWSTLKVVGTN